MATFVEVRGDDTRNMQKDAAHQFAMSWTDLRMVVRPRKGETKTILDGVSGIAKPGELVALMGPSGSGKTTLLDVLANRIDSSRIEGAVEIGGVKRETKTSRRLVNYVAQEDALLTCFTVGETLAYAARLVLASFSAADRAERIQLVLQQVGLQDAVNTRVGDPLIKGLSGGQKRRLSIALELLQEPPILLLDEPTSGLDSTSAQQVVETLRRVAAAGNTVIVSIHQPSTIVYNLFDSVCLLSRGKQVYFGPTGPPALEFFANNGQACPAFTNPAEHFLDLINTDFRPEQRKVVDELAAAYSTSQKLSLPKPDVNDPAKYTGAKGAGYVMQFLILLTRITHQSVKNPYIYMVRVVMYVALSFMVGTMYSGVGTAARESESIEEADRAAQKLLPCLFYVQAFLVFMSVAVLPFFLEQRDVFRRERANGDITSLPYVVANFLAGLPCIAVIALVSSAFVVGIADLNGFSDFFLSLLLSLVVAESLMHVIGAAQPHYIIGMALGAGIFGMFMLCEGFMVPKDEIPAGWMWGYHLAFHTYSFKWFMYNQFSGEDGGLVGGEILKRFGIEEVDTTECAVVLLIYTLVLEVAFYAVLKIFHTGRRS
uniref:ABC transporter domain-containing protein n=1 Tax=Oxyrrhis marina TaxID=2969 RepID=A0A7S4GMP4_OXYMA